MSSARLSPPPEVPDDDEIDGFLKVRRPDGASSDTESQVEDQAPSYSPVEVPDIDIDDEVERIVMLAPEDLESVRVADGQTHDPRPLNNSTDKWVWAQKFKDYIQKGEDGKILRYCDYQRPGEILDLPDPNEASDASELLGDDASSTDSAELPDDTKSINSSASGRMLATTKKRRQKKKKAKKNKKPAPASHECSSDDDHPNQIEAAYVSGDESDHGKPSLTRAPADQPSNARPPSKERHHGNPLVHRRLSPSASSKGMPPHLQGEARYRELPTETLRPSLNAVSDNGNLQEGSAAQPRQATPSSTRVPTEHTIRLPSTAGARTLAPSAAERSSGGSTSSYRPASRDEPKPPADASPRLLQPALPRVPAVRPQYRVPLDEDFTVIERPSRFFKTGRIFMTVWFEGGCRDPPRSPSSMQWRDVCPPYRSIRPYAGFRWFVVVRKKANHSLCLDIFNRTETSGSRGDEHCVLHSALVDAPEPAEDETVAGDPISIIVEHQSKFIAPTARLDMSRVYTVEHNLRVMKLGRVHPSSMGMLETHYQNAIQ